MSERDPSTHDTHTNVVINVAKNEHESKEKDDYTLIGSTLKTYAKAYKELRGTWVNLTDDIFSELQLTYKNKNSTGLNVIPVPTALDKIREIKRTLKTQDKTPGNMPPGVPSGRGRS